MALILIGLSTYQLVTASSTEPTPITEPEWGSKPSNPKKCSPNPKRFINPKCTPTPEPTPTPTSVPTATPTSAPPTPTLEPPPVGLVAWWPGEGNANDIVGGNHGTLQGGTTFSMGIIGQAFSFDGTDDFVLVPDSQDLTLPGDVTFTFWAKRTVLDGTWSNMFGKGDNPVSYRMAFGPGNDLRGDFEHDGGSDVDIKGPTVIDTNFHHYAYVRNGNTHRMFFDGAEVASGSFSGTATAAIGEPVVIGVLRSEPDPSDRQYFGGIVDEVKLFNRALTNEEVLAISNES